MVAAYRLPQLVRGWEAGLVRFLLARVTDTSSFGSRVAAAFHGREHLTQIERLVDVVAKHRIPARRRILASALKIDAATRGPGVYDDLT